MASPLDVELTKLLRPYLEFPCCGGKLHLGAMFYLDFGQTFISATRSGERIEIGEMTLSVREVAWSFFCNGTLVAEAVSITGEKFERLLADVKETCIQRISMARTLSTLELYFDGGLRLSVDLTRAGTQ